MARGKAHGVDRQYQVSCRNVLRARYPDVEPWEGDGIDVSFNLPDTGWTIDVAYVRQMVPLWRPNADDGLVPSSRRM